MMHIVGLPRSRTAWLSAFMSQSSIFFHHEAINGCRTMEEYASKTKGFGDSTTGFMHLLNKKDGKTVIIKKNDDEIMSCIDWCDQNFGMDSESYILEMNNSLNMMDGLVVDQSNIDNSLQEIWEFLVDDEWHDRFADIKHLNIQARNNKIDEIAARALYESLQ